MGLRELKKQQARQLIADTAWRLFTERGFDKVTVAEIARTAQVSETTVFNYFPAKEDLIYSRLEAYGSQLVQAVAERAPGESALTAVRRFLLDGPNQLEKIEAGDTEALQQLRTFNTILVDSPALLAREQQAIAANTQALAARLADETGDEFTATAVAHTLMGVHRALLEFVRQRVLSDSPPGALATDLRTAGGKAFALLEQGLGDYARRET